MSDKEMFFVVLAITISFFTGRTLYDVRQWRNEWREDQKKRAEDSRRLLQRGTYWDPFRMKDMRDD